MIPYGLLFYTILMLDIKKYNGIWQDWLCMQIENGVEIEPWMLCLSENPIIYDTVFEARLEEEKKAFTDGRADFYFFAVGFACKMFAEKNITSKEIYTVVDRYNEDLGTYMYYYTNDPEKRNTPRELEDELNYAENYFNTHVWDNIPKETQKLFYS